MIHVYTIVYMYSEALNTGYLLHTYKYSVYYILLPFFITILFFQMTSDLFVSVACRIFIYYITFSSDVHRTHLQ